MAKIPEHNNIKRLKGEKDKRRFLPDGISIEPLTELPPPNENWDIKVVKMYESEGAKLIAHGMLSTLDLKFLGWYCLLGTKLERLWDAGETPSMSMVSQLTSMSGYLGLNPIARQKFKAPVDPKKGNKFSK